MTVLAKLLTAAVLIAAFMLLRIVAGRSVLRQRLRAGQSCAESSCSGGCRGDDGDAADDQSREVTSGPTKRRANHASR